MVEFVWYPLECTDGKASVVAATRVADRVPVRCMVEMVGRWLSYHSTRQSRYLSTFTACLLGHIRMQIAYRDIVEVCCNSHDHCSIRKVIEPFMQLVKNAMGDGILGIRMYVPIL